MEQKQACSCSCSPSDAWVFFHFSVFLLTVVGDA
ncbi:hypothetical protein CKAN_00726400 [Cinnamomum micranthum f. kanehirae]|uniref:Uncharacterized protein n=1 Tax=Cinnamomum micranthum f. kanehirae TaxID=337451 RepID=A0A3S3Q4R4_9MAGN|nr:hypothetical protein CKAN_00726400 [Cinnamomum micranthum f. kanehirae]